MNPLPNPAKTDLAQPAVAAEYLRTCRGMLAKLNLPEAFVALLDEMAIQLGDTDPELATYLRQQASRIGTGDEIRHAVRHGVPQIALTRRQVTERLRQEEDRRLSRVKEVSRLLRMRGALLVTSLLLAASMGAALWGVLWLVGIDNPWGAVIGLIAAAGLCILFQRGLRRALLNLVAQEGQRSP
jgi:hypothetical protein